MSSTSREEDFYEKTLYQALVNEGKHHTLLQAKRFHFTYDEKRLREEAAEEVAMMKPTVTDEDKTRKRKHLSADEKAKQNRNRNREHAKNTRLRKKAYVNKLKNLVDQLSHMKQVESRERRILGVRIHETQIARKNAIKLLLDYRASDVRNRSKWTAIVHEGVVTTVPITPFRWFHKSDIVNSARVFVGIDALIRDNASQAFMARDIGLGKDAWMDHSSAAGSKSPLLTIEVKDEDVITAGDLLMCCYVMTLDVSHAVGQERKCSQMGMIQCKFNSTNKIVALELIYDVMGFMQQLQRANLINPDNGIVPNTLSMALQASSEPRLIVRTEPPFHVVHLNEAWHALKNTLQNGGNSMTISDAVKAVRSPQDPQALFSMLLSQACTCRPVSGIVEVYTSDSGESLSPSSSCAPRKTCYNYVKVTPLSDRSDLISHALITILDIPNTEMAQKSMVPGALVSGTNHKAMEPNVSSNIALQNSEGDGGGLVGECESGN